MTQYFFHIRDGDALIEDPDGEDYQSVEEARSEAILSARDLLAARLKSGEILDGQTIEITTADGDIVAIVPLKDAINNG
jgi:hypothetical protein